MPGLNKFGDKEKRKARRTNQFARALSSPLYRQRVLPNKKPNKWDEEDYRTTEDTDT